MDDKIALRPESVAMYKNPMKMLLDRITIDPEICHGKPSVRGLRYPVEMILELLSGGMSSQDIIRDYEDLNEEDIRACLLFASKLSQVKSVYKLAS